MAERSPFTAVLNFIHTCGTRRTQNFNIRFCRELNSI